ncbi:unnamed protein product [Mycena citricolor]|uniref:Uncharacterized protein n=1 Tax=Mycena citricolor TaxID=2018698 RepID=A0AAD2Q0T1_9AGAR|nr:unnamed protein product [Mycena citricolor]
MDSRQPLQYDLSLAAGHILLASVLVSPSDLTCRPQAFASWVYPRDGMRRRVVFGRTRSDLARRSISAAVASRTAQCVGWPRTIRRCESISR